MKNIANTQNLAKQINPCLWFIRIDKNTLNYMHSFCEIKLYIYKKESQEV